MAAIPPVMLVLDISTLSSATPREWIEFSRVGTCCIPQVIYEEMRLLFDRSPDPDLERISREFSRFYPHSGWKITDVVGHHAALKTTTSHALTKRARVSLAVAKCAYGLAQEFPQNLVVLVASDRELQQKIYDMQINNLSARIPRFWADSMEPQRTTTDRRDSEDSANAGDSWFQGSG
ncbi:MAG: hypothetical protein HC840_01405 [Leptolyngbyaceae cyanobacterium RM2_2_4]|nr:hypothetical protein [Leptolyngbyaceae cyanobacterium RM2_2_4]